MFLFRSIPLLSVAAYVSGSPTLVRRIAQNTPASTTLWEKACNAAGGGLKCNPTSVAAFGTLLAAAGPCAQQDAADNMIDLAKSLNNDPTMIKLTQVFAQQPRNTPTSLSVPYCEQAPRNSELTGLFQCQFAGANPTVFVGSVPVGKPGTIPFGHATPLSPAGSCPAHTSGSIADGTQLVDLTQDPGVGASAPNSGSGGPPVAKGARPASTSTSATPAATGAPPASVPTPSDSPASGDFRLQNGKDAQALNAKFATLTASSPCTEGQQACVSGGFAQCVGGKFVLQPCTSPLTCAALPLVNKPGTSVTCTTMSDALARIAATGASGGLTGA